MSIKERYSHNYMIFVLKNLPKSPIAEDFGKDAFSNCLGNTSQRGTSTPPIS